MKLCHVTKAWDGHDLESMAQRLGESEALAKYARKWPEAAEMGYYHVQYVHCWESLDEAREHAAGSRMQILEITLDDEWPEVDVETDSLEFSHPVIRDSIPANLIRKLTAAERR